MPKRASKYGANLRIGVLSPLQFGCQAYYTTLRLVWQLQNGPPSCWGKRAVGFFGVVVGYDVGSGVGVGGSSRKSSRIFSTKSLTTYSPMRT